MSARCTLCLLALSLTFGCRAPYTSVRGLSFHDLEYPMDVLFTDIDGIRIAYSDSGQGSETLLLVHGLGSNMAFWMANREALAEGYRVLTIDLPGFGKSAREDYRYSMEFYARVVDTFIDTLMLENVTLVSHSMGGQISLTHALLFPGKVKRLVLAAPAGLEHFSPGEREWFKEVITPKLFMSTDPETVYVNFAHNFVKMPPAADRLVIDRLSITSGPDFEQYAYVNARCVIAMVEEPVDDRLGEVDLPVLVVFGTGDALIPNPVLHGGSTEAIARESAARFPDARVVMIPRAGHLVQLEQPDKFNAAVLEFLDETAGR